MKNRLNSDPLEKVITKLSTFLTPVLTGECNGQTWKPESGWIIESS